MSLDIFDINSPAYSRNDPKYRKGVAAMEDWHDRCRRRRIEAAIEAKKKELSLKRIAAERDRLLKKDAVPAAQHTVPAAPSLRGSTKKPTKNKTTKSSRK